MVDEARRRILRLALLAAGTTAGAGYLLNDWRRGDDPTSRVATGTKPTTSAAPAPSTTSSTSAPTTSTRTPSTGAPAPTTTAPRAAGAPSGGAVAVLCREAWEAAPPTGALPPHQIAGLMVHHTAVVLDDNRKSPDRILGHQRFHQRKGFVDIAYHVFVDAHGNVFEGRDQSQPGETFTDYDPAGWFLVVCEGNFDEQPLPDAQRDALTRVLAWAGHRYGVAPEDIASHRDHAHTRCPGDAIHALVLDGTLSRLTRAAGSVELEELCGPDADTRVAAIRAGTL